MSTRPCKILEPSGAGRESQPALPNRHFTDSAKRTPLHRSVDGTKRYRRPSRRRAKRPPFIGHSKNETRTNVGGGGLLGGRGGSQRISALPGGTSPPIPFPYPPLDRPTVFLDRPCCSKTFKNTPRFFCGGPATATVGSLSIIINVPWGGPDRTIFREHPGGSHVGGV